MAPAFHTAVNVKRSSSEKKRCNKLKLERFLSSLDIYFHMTCSLEYPFKEEVKKTTYSYF